MKLSTLLLSSAALVVAGSAYAADLPAKKGAPAAKAATGCPAFGAGFFQIPGGDTCIKFSGYMRSQTEYSSVDKAASTAGSARVEFDARSNTELGALKGYTRVDLGSAASSDRAYVSVAGLTAGKYGALTDIAGTGGAQAGALGGDSGTGLSYALPLGSFTVTGAVQNPSTTGDGTDNQDLLVGVSTKAAGADITVYGATHSNDAGAGYAYVASASFTAGVATVGVFGGTSHGAISYTGTTTNFTADSDGTTMTDGSVVGVRASVAAGNGYVFADYYSVSATDGTDTDNETAYEVGTRQTIAKGLYVQPSIYHAETSGENIFTLRINRDF